MACGLGAGQGQAVKAERPPGAQRAALEVAGVERLQRMVGGDRVPYPPAARNGGRAVEGVEQLAERYGRRDRGAGAVVGAGVDDDQVVLGGADRVEQQLAVLTAWVALADPRVAGEHVVAVADA